MYGYGKCPFCGKYISNSTYDEDGGVCSSTSKKRGSKSTVYYHKKCYDAEMAKRKAAREKRLKEESGEGHRPL